MEEHPVQGEEEFPGTHLLWSSLFSSSFGNSLAQSGNRWSDLHRHVFDRCGVLCSLVPFHFVKCPKFGFQGYVLGQIICNLGLWDWIAGFDLLLIINITHQAVPLDIRNVLPSRDSSEFVWSEATASEVHHTCSFGALPCSSFSGCNSVPTSEARSTVRILRNGDAVGCEVSRNRGQGVIRWRHVNVQSRRIGMLQHRDARM